MSTSNQTHDHQTIKEWVEKRKGVPSKIKGTDKTGDEGVLRIHFPKHSQSNNFDEVSWDEFFEEFEDKELDFLFQDKKANGETSTFHKFVQRK
ncbi:hypothetical protein [Pedobacter sp.]|uniref:hypothetical protein n=1 Tax=Pedobacter sp. TaxID=1411316 RepID=UPI003D7F8C86